MDLYLKDRGSSEYPQVFYITELGACCASGYLGSPEHM